MNNELETRYTQIDDREREPEAPPNNTGRGNLSTMSKFGDAGSTLGFLTLYAAGLYLFWSPNFISNDPNNNPNYIPVKVVFTVILTVLMATAFVYLCYPRSSTVRNVDRGRDDRPLVESRTAPPPTTADTPPAASPS